MDTALEKTEVGEAEAKKIAGFSSFLPLTVILAFWAFCLLFIGAAGDFPLNDDWIYAESVKHFLATGQLRLIACSPACIFHVIFASALSKLFGFSFMLLRVIGFFWAVIASLAMFGCCLRLRLSRAAALLMALCFAANPLFICLAFSFMTDMPALALTCAYTFFLLGGLKKHSEPELLAASLCLVAATCVRQNLGCLACVNLAVLIFIWLRKRHSWSLLFGVLAPLAAAYLADKWMLSTCDFTSVYLWYRGMATKQVLSLLRVPASSIPRLIQVAGELFGYLGVFLLPVLVFFLPALGRCFANRGNINPAVPLASASTVLFSLCRFVFEEQRWMPFSQNIIRLPELGAHTILGINYAALSLRWKQRLTIVCGLCGFVFGTLIIDSIVKTLRSLWRFARSPSGSSEPAALRRAGNAFCAFAVVLLFLVHFAFNCLQSTFVDIDRYYLFPLMGSIPLLALAWRLHRVRLSVFAVAPLLLVLAAYSVAATQDNLAWNRARWHALLKLESQGVNFKRIDGGSEYNYLRDPALSKSLILQGTQYESTHRGQPPRDQWRWWSVADEEYIISFSPVPGYDVAFKEPYWSALGGKREILVLHRL